MFENIHMLQGKGSSQVSKPCFCRLSEGMEEEFVFSLPLLLTLPYAPNTKLYVLSISLYVAVSPNRGTSV